MDMRNWDLFDKLVETLGEEKLAEELIRYMDSDTANRYLESIAREYEIEYEGRTTIYHFIKRVGEATQSPRDEAFENAILRKHSPLDKW